MRSSHDPHRWGRCTTGRRGSRRCDPRSGWRRRFGRRLRDRAMDRVPRSTHSYTRTTADPTSARHITACPCAPPWGSGRHDRKTISWYSASSLASATGGGSNGSFTAHAPRCRQPPHLPDLASGNRSRSIQRRCRARIGPRSLRHGRCNHQVLGIRFWASARAGPVFGEQFDAADSRPTGRRRPT